MWGNKHLNLQIGSSIFKLRWTRMEGGTVFSINWSTDCEQKHFNELKARNKTTFGVYIVCYYFIVKLYAINKSAQWMRRKGW